mgnify:FL=1
MAWWNNNNQPAQNSNTLNLGLANGQQQVPMTGAYGQAGFQNQYTPPPPPSEMEILSALITQNPSIDKWLSDNNGQNMASVVALLSNLITVSLHQLLANAKIKETEDGFAFDFSGISGMPTPDSVTMTQTQILNGASNNVQQMNMQFQQMVAMANQSAIQSALDSALADPSMLQAAGQGAGTFLRSVMTGGR